VIAIAPTIRSATAADQAARRAIFHSVKSPPLESIGWSAAAIEQFCDQQFEIRDRSLAMSVPTADRSVIVVGDEVVGELIVDRDRDPWAIVDIALLTDHRSQGVGTAVLGDVLSDADPLGVAVELHVDLDNPARSLYERLGFVVTGSTELQYLMRRPATREESE